MYAHTHIYMCARVCVCARVRACVRVFQVLFESNMTKNMKQDGNIN